MGCVRWRPYYLPRIELFLGGILLADALEGSSNGAVVTLLVAGVLVVDAIRREGAPGLWLLGLGFCATVSRLSVTETEAALGILRIPILAGGTLLAIALGAVMDPEFRRSLRRARL